MFTTGWHDLSRAVGFVVAPLASFLGFLGGIFCFKSERADIRSPRLELIPLFAGEHTLQEKRLITSPRRKTPPSELMLGHVEKQVANEPCCQRLECLLMPAGTNISRAKFSEASAGAPDRRLLRSCSPLSAVIAPEPPSFSRKWG